MPLGVGQAPEGEGQGHFYQCFDILLILAQNAESVKSFQVQNVMVYGNRHNYKNKF